MRWLGLCRRWQRLLPAYRLGQLGAAEQRRVDLHLAACVRCRAELALHEAVAQALVDHDPAAPVADTETQRLIESMARAARLDPTRRPRLVLAPLAAALLFGVGVLAGGRLYPRVETREVVRQVPVERVVERVVEKVIEKRVEVPVEVPVERVVVKVQTRWRGSSSGGEGGASQAQPVKPAASPTPVTVPVGGGSSGAGTTARPASVRF